MFRNKTIDALNVYLDKIDRAIDELKRARGCAINAKANLLRGGNVDATTISTVEDMILLSAIKQSSRVDAVLTLACDAANERT